MEHSELRDRAERLTARIVDQHSPFRNGRHHAVVDEVVHEPPRRPVGEVCCRLFGVSVLSELFGFEPLVVGTRRTQLGQSWEFTRRIMSASGPPAPITISLLLGICGSQK